MRAATEGYPRSCCWRKTKCREAKMIIVKLIESKKRNFISKLTMYVNTET